MTNIESVIYELLLQNDNMSISDLSIRAGFSEVMTIRIIDSLIQKGYITRDGQVNKHIKKVVAIGGSNIDIEGKCSFDTLMYDSNIGKVKFASGGVGRNIATTFARLGGDIQFVTALGSDDYGKKIYEQLKLLNINVDDIIISKDYSTSTYMYILGSDGEMILAVNDMSIVELINEDVVLSLKSKIDDSDFLFFDCNLSDDAIKAIFDVVINNKIMVDPVSVYKVNKIVPYLDKIYCLKLNDNEATAIVGFDVDSVESAKKASKIIIDRGVKKVFITLGAKGVVFACENKVIYKDGFKANVINATGAGDAFSGAVLYGFTRDYDDEKIVEFGMGASLVTIECADTCDDNISVEKIVNRLNTKYC